MNLRRYLFIALQLCVAIVIVSACGGASAPAGSAPAGSNTAATSAPGAAAPAATTASGSGASAAGSQQYAGTTLRFLAANHPWADAIKTLLPDFEKQTGIKVNIEQYGEDQLTQKLTTEFTAGGSNIDVFMQRPLQEAKLYVQNNWYTDLNTYLNDPNKTPADYDLKDFSPASIGTEKVKNMMTGLPIVVEQEVLYYRKDLLPQPPKTLDELKADATKLNGQNGVFGFAARGQASPAVTQFSSFLYSFGGDWFDQTTRKATLNTPEAVAAFKFYGDLLRSYGPPGVQNMSWPQAVAIFAQGKVATYTDANSIFSNVLDPTKSTVADKTGIAQFPAGPKGSNMYSVTSWGLSMSANAPHKDAAWEFIKWATSKDIVLKTQSQGTVPGARQSVWDQPGATGKFPPDWVAAMKASVNGKPYDRPLVINVGKARDIIGTVITTAIQGGDVQKAADQANKDFQALLDQEKG
jgi:multiple sugar transport system substrate-binding protein